MLPPATPRAYPFAMRAPAALGILGTCLLAGCTSTVLAEPQLLVSPYLAVYQLRGAMSMQSTPVDPIQDNPKQSLRTFGQDHHREDIGVRADLGDGFAGIRFDYYRLHMGTSQKGVLDGDWGRLQNGDLVRMNANMDDFRLSYLEPIVSTSGRFRDKPFDLKFAAGAQVSHRLMTLQARTDDGSRTQNAQIDGDAVYGAVRARLAWREVALDLDYAVSPGLVLGGDFEGLQQDFEAMLKYSLPMRDVTFFGGFRYSEFPAKGDANGFAYDADLKLDGYQFGFAVVF